MGPTRHNTQQRYHEEGTWRKFLKNYPNFLFNLFDSLHMPCLISNTPQFCLIMCNPFPETMIFHLKGQERTHPLSFCFLPRMTPCSFCFLCFLKFVCVVQFFFFYNAAYMHSSSSLVQEQFERRQFMPLVLPPL